MGVNEFWHMSCKSMMYIYMLSYQVIKSHRYMIYVAIAMHYVTCRLIQQNIIFIASLLARSIKEYEQRIVES
jgi:hypothetical protein